jgi:hypothetical protein
MQRISVQLSGLMSSLAGVEKLAAALQADTDATRKVRASPSQVWTWAGQGANRPAQCMGVCVGW